MSAGKPMPKKLDTAFYVVALLLAPLGVVLLVERVSDDDVLPTWFSLGALVLAVVVVAVVAVVSRRYGPPERS